MLISLPRNGSEDVNAALALLSGDPAVAPLVADYHVVTVDAQDPGPNLEHNQAIAARMFLDLGTSGLPAGRPLTRWGALYG